MWRFTITCSLLCTTLQLGAQPLRLTTDDLKPDTADIRYRYALTYEGDSIGYSNIEITYDQGQFKLREVTQIEGFSEIIVVRGDAGTLEPYAVVVTGETGGHGIDCQMQIGRRITGYARYPDHPDHPMRTMDTTLIPDLIERTCSFFLYLPLMPLDSVPQVTFTQLNTLSCTLHQIIVTDTQKTQRIKTNAGTFNTTRVEFRGGLTSQNFYISTSAPKVIARISFEELPWQYELIAYERGES